MGILNIAPAERAGAHLLIQLYGPPRSGKTYTAVSSIYRLIKFGGAKRVLFLVDRSNLARQTLPRYEPDDGPLTPEQLAAIDKLVPQGRFKPSKRLF